MFSDFFSIANRETTSGQVESIFPVQKFCLLKNRKFYNGF